MVLTLHPKPTTVLLWLHLYLWSYYAACEQCRPLEHISLPNWCLHTTQTTALTDSFILLFKKKQKAMFVTACMGCPRLGKEDKMLKVLVAWEMETATVGGTTWTKHEHTTSIFLPCEEQGLGENERAFITEKNCSILCNVYTGQRSGSQWRNGCKCNTFFKNAVVLLKEMSKSHL